MSKTGVAVAVSIAGLISDCLTGASAAPAQSIAAYQQKCEICHESAADFARQSLALRDGVVIGRSNQEPIADFLMRHGKLTKDEIPIVVEHLGRLLRDTVQPPVRN